MSSEPKPHDKLEPAAAPTREVRTIVGVPTLDAGAPPQVPPAPQSASEMGTAVDMKTLSKDEADRILAWTGFTQEEIPTALGVAPQAPVSKSPYLGPPPSSGTPKQKTMQTQGGLGPPDGNSRMTKQGVAPSGATRLAVGRPPGRPSSRPPPVPGRRATLVMDAGAPSNDEPPSITDRPPIVVPAASGLAPKAVTQPPPWGNERVELAGLIPRAGALPRPPAESIEEVSASVILPDADDEDLIATRHAATGAMVEELSGSMLLPDESKPPANARTAARPLPPPTTTSRPPPVASKPPPPPLGSRAPPVLSAPPARSIAPPLAPPAPPPPPPAPPQQAWGNDDVPLPADVPIPPPPDVISHPAWPPAFAAVPTPPPPATDVEPSAPIRHVPTLPMPAFNPDLPGGAPLPIAVLAEKISDKITERVLHYLPPSNPLRSRPKVIVPVVLGAGGLVTFLFIALVISAFSSSADRPTATAIAGVAWRVAAVAPTAPVSPSTTTSASTAALPAVASTAPCAVTGASHVVSPRADMHLGVEARATGDGVALAFAPSKKDALVVSLDPATLSASGSSHTRTGGSIRRLTPIVTTGGSVTAVVDTDRKGDRLSGRRYIAGDAPVDVGVTDSSIVAATHGSHDTSSLWAVEDSTPLDALRGVSFTLGGKHAYAIAFRRAGAVFAGVFSGDTAFTANGALARFDGLGTKVGSPTIAVSNETVLVAWADRASNADPWSIRVAHFHAGDAATGAQTFVAPPGGLGANIMSPRASALPGGRFLFVWAEGPLAATQVRAETLDGAGSLLGAAMTVSADGVNSGAGDSAVTADGRGIVSFLSASSASAKKFEVEAVPLSCPL